MITPFSDHSKALDTELLRGRWIQNAGRSEDVPCWSETDKEGRKDFRVRNSEDLDGINLELEFY